MVNKRAAAPLRKTPHLLAASDGMISSIEIQDRLFSSDLPSFCSIFLHAPLPSAETADAPAPDPRG